MTLYQDDVMLLRRIYLWTFWWNAVGSCLYCLAASIFSGSSKSHKSVNKEFNPQITSFSDLVGVHPDPSNAELRNMLRHTDPSESMFGCQTLVRHFTDGGSILYPSGTLILKTNLPRLHIPSSGWIVSCIWWILLASGKDTLHDGEQHTSNSASSCVNKRSLIENFLTGRGFPVLCWERCSLIFCCNLNICTRCYLLLPCHITTIISL